MPNVEQVLNDYEAQGAEEQAIVAKLKEHLSSLDEKLATIEVFASPEAYLNYDTEFTRALMDGDIDKAKEIASQLEIRTLPYQLGMNKQTSFPELYSLDYGYYWTTLHMMIFIG